MAVVGRQWYRIATVLIFSIDAEEVRAGNERRPFCRGTKAKRMTHFMDRYGVKISEVPRWRSQVIEKPLSCCIVVKIDGAAPAGKSARLPSSFDLVLKCGGRRIDLIVFCWSERPCRNVLPSKTARPPESGLTSRQATRACINDVLVGGDRCVCDDGRYVRRWIIEV